MAGAAIMSSPRNTDNKVQSLFSTAIIGGRLIDIQRFQSDSHQ